LGCGLLKGWRRNEKKVLFSGCGVVAFTPMLCSRIERVAFALEFDSRRSKCGAVEAEDDPREVDA